MGNKGFTLIELIATIALLAVISIISFVSVNGILNESRINDCNTLIDSIKNATKEYVSDNRYKSSFNGSVNMEQLIRDNYISGNIVHPITKEQISTDSIRINIELYDDYTVKTVDVVGIDCST